MSNYQSQAIRSINDKIGNLRAREFRYVIEQSGDLLGDLYSLPFKLVCINENDKTIRETLGDYNSLSSAQNRAMEHLKANRNSVGEIWWEDVHIAEAMKNAAAMKKKSAARQKTGRH